MAKAIRPFARVSTLLLATAILGSSEARADDPVFSGPQVGERLVPFKARAVLGESAGKEFDLVGQARGGPLLIVFVHESTRPSIGLTRTVIEYAKKHERDGLMAGVVFLADDATEMEAFIKRASHALPGGVPLGISVDGEEGPGAYGLNRNVTLTVLVGKDNRVTANFALVQPSLPQDAPRIGHAIVKVLGGGDEPTLEEMGGSQWRRMQRRRAAGDDRFAALLRPVIRRGATAEQVTEAAEKVEAHAAENEAFRKRVASTAQRIVNAGRLENYGTPAAQAYLKKWAAALSENGDPPAEEPDQGDDSQ